MRRADVLMAAGVGGFVGPMVFAGLVIILGALYPGYSHVSQTVSVLGAADAPHKAIMNALGFPLLGLCVIALGAGVEVCFKRKGVGRTGPALLAVCGTALVMIAIFNADPGDIDVSWRGMTHTAFSVVSEVSFAIAPVFIAMGLFRDVKWKAYSAYSYATAIITLLFALVSVLGIVDTRVGLFQRMSMGIPMLWMMVTSVKLLSESRSYRSVSAGPINAEQPS